jgi:hypothetical protein
MYGSSVAEGHDPVSGRSEGGSDEQQEEEKYFRTPLRTLKRKAII